MAASRRSLGHGEGARPSGRRHAWALVACGALAALASARGRVPAGADRTAALTGVLRGRGLSVASPEDIVWIEARGGLVGSARAIVRASSGSDPAEIWLVETHLSPEGVLLDVGDAHDLTETTGADEQRPIALGERVAFVAKDLVEGDKSTVHVIDLAGRSGPAPNDWTRLERAQNAITAWQQTGQLRGVLRHSVVVDPPPRDVRIALDDSGLTVRADGREGHVTLSASGAAPSSGSDPAWAKIATAEISRPGNVVTWAVDRVRAIPWIGDDAMQTVKAVAFTALDFVLRNKEAVTGDNGADGIAEDLGKNELDPPVRALPVDPEIGWPPAPLVPWVTPTLPGEGEWNARDKDPFVRMNPGLPPAFLTTFIRSDRERKATRVYIAVWDPRQVELHMMAGTIEPKGATGEAGPGLVPRTPEVMKRVVAASNAGFQAMHGEFGMMADGVVYLPPKPYAATVAVLRDGSTAFGTWPLDPAIPDTVRSYRQNMTVMVENEKFNPYNRTWWGGTPPGWADKTHTVRTGICLTKEHFIAYFYGADVGPEALAQAMIQTRCAFGIALDMNAGHSGLEFYKVAPEAELDADPVGRILQHDWEQEGEVPGMDGWKFRGRRLIRGMGLMNFPRYIKREARDFFYMTLRHVLPGEPLSPVVQPPAAGEGEWKLKGLPQHGFPYALASTEIRPDPARPDLKARLLKIDPRTVAAAPASRAADDKSATVAVLAEAEAPTKPAAAHGEALTVWASPAAFAVADAAPVPEAVRIASGVAKGPAAAAIGVHDEDGMLVYVELATPPAAPTAADGELLAQLLQRAGCSQRVMLSAPLALALGGDTSLAGEAVRPPSGANAVRLSRAVAPGGKRFFEDTPVVPFMTWYTLQQQRIRYFKKPPKTEAPAEP